MLSDRLRTAGALDGLFAADLAARVDHFTRTGGKRTRAQLLWWSLRACGGGSENIVSGLRLGAAIELLQTCALVHDDVMDGSRLRRGGRALHADVEAQYAACAPAHQVTRFSAAAGILAGDLALVWADDLVAETALPEPSARAVRRVWSDMRTQMVAGQYLDVHGQVTAVHSPARALRAACLKSALYSVERPLTLGAVLAGADNATRRALYAAGRCVGVAFQLRDDLTDVFGEAGTPGEDCGGDVREGKTTYLLALARARAEAAGDGEALAVLDASLGDAALTGPGLDEVRHVVERTGARGAVEKKIGRLLDLGLRHYDGAVLDPVGGAPLRRLLRRAASGASSSDPDPRPAPRGAGAPAATSREARR
nr:polyprenyl synthetase family protein [Streptomyces zhaozhouensis]